jgi:hypothetical protein
VSLEEASLAEMTGIGIIEITETVLDIEVTYIIGRSPNKGDNNRTELC